MSTQIITGDALATLRAMPNASADCCVTSPPFFKMRDYGVPGQIGLEATPADFADALCAVFAEVRRVLRPGSACWVQIDDTYAAGGNGGGGSLVAKRRQWTGAQTRKGWRRRPDGFKEKDLTLSPFVVADALRADGWWLRSVIIWDKMVAIEPPRLDRPQNSFGYLFLLANGEQYRVRDPGEPWFHSTIWAIRPTSTVGIGHPAVMPSELARRCILCSTEQGETVLDPFAGAGTSLLAADCAGRHGIGIELNPAYADIARDRIRDAAPLFAAAAE